MLTNIYSVNSSLYDYFMVAMPLAGKQIPETVIIKVHHLSKPLQVRGNGSTDGRTTSQGRGQGTTSNEG